MKHDSLKIILGPPGTGKTHELLATMEREIASGTSSRQIAFLTFTKKAAQTAKDRAMEQFHLSDDDLPWFRTIHSLVFRQTGVRKPQVIGRSHHQELGRKLGVEFTGGVYTEEGMASGIARGDTMVFLENLGRVTGCGLRAIWEDSDHGLGWEELAMFAKAYKIFKSAKGLVDFTDMLEMFCDKTFAPPVDVLFVDEAQDLSDAQWNVIAIIASKCRRVYVAGDDDQAIYRWAGADVEQFINLAGETIVLDQSRRISAAAHDLATSVISRIKNRKEKVFKPRSLDGEVRWITDLEELDLYKGTWLLLARNSYMLPELETYCLHAGVNFDSPGHGSKKARLLRAIMTWERVRAGGRATVEEMLSIANNFANRGWTRPLRSLESTRLLDKSEMQAHGLKIEAIWHEAMDLFPREERDYFVSVRTRGEKLLGQARVQIRTIHGVKGGEADNVMLMTDLSLAAYTSMTQRSADDETRVFYVGLTRARENLYLMSPRTNLSFPL